MTIWNFIQDEIFGMKWLERLIASLLGLCGFDTGSRLGGSVLFFLYDMIKIMVLLAAIMFLLHTRTGIGLRALFSGGIRMVR